MVTINLKGAEKLIKEIKKRERLLWPTIMGTMEEYVAKMVEDAKQNAPEDLGEVKAGIGSEKKGDRALVFFQASAHGVMQEFGTKTRMVDIPDLLKEEAQKFKGYKNGNMTAFVAAIEDWCRRKGIDVEAAYMIAVSILDKGTEPQPYFYPAYKKWEEEMIRTIKERVTKLLDF